MKKRNARGLPPVVIVLLALCAVLLAVLAGLLGLLFARYTWAAGSLREKGDSPLDLRGETISLAQYQELTRTFPGRDILWSVPLSTGPVPFDAAEVRVSRLSGEDWQLLELMPGLTMLDASGCDDYERLTDFQARHPGCRVRYTVELEGQEYPNDTQSVTVSRLSSLSAVLPYLPQVTQVVFPQEPPLEEELAPVQAAYPHIFFRRLLHLGDFQIDSAAEEMNLSDLVVTAQEVSGLMAKMPCLTFVDLQYCPLEDSEVLALAEQYPNCRILWQVRLGEQTFRTDARELDVSGWQLGSPQELERYLPLFYNLERVVMCGCGLDDETMDELNRKYEDIRFVWSVRIKNVDVRTDATWFYPFKYYQNMVVTEEDLYPLRYCTDMVAIDIGHMTQVTTCEWVRNMPNLKYFIIAETAITDISPLSTLKNLVFLEIFTTKITDYTPLLGCTALEDLNLGKTYGDPGPILQMTWLKNLWWSGIQGTYGLPCSDAPQRLREALPNTTMKFNLETPNVNNGWRQLDNYYAMRDLMDVFYLT